MQITGYRVSIQGNANLKTFGPKAGEAARTYARDFERRFNIVTTIWAVYGAAIAKAEGK